MRVVLASGHGTIMDLGEFQGDQKEKVKGMEVIPTFPPEKFSWVRRLRARDVIFWDCAVEGAAAQYNTLLYAFGCGTRPCNVFLCEWQCAADVWCECSLLSGLSLGRRLRGRSHVKYPGCVAVDAV